MKSLISLQSLVHEKAGDGRNNTSKYEVFSWVAERSPNFGAGYTDILILAMESAGMSYGEPVEDFRLKVRSASENIHLSNVISG